LGVDGEARELFIEQGNAGLYFEPENYSELSKSILQLYNNQALSNELGNNGKSFVLKILQEAKLPKIIFYNYKIFSKKRRTISSYSIFKWLL
jgi:hypothetical protein